MINTFFQAGRLDEPRAFLAALLIGIAFGFFLERAGFGSSRKLTGVFYFRDMAVIKVMFTAVMTALLGLLVCVTLGWASFESIYLMPTVYGAYIVGGLLFGVGFVMGGWCPGTAAAGLAGGKLDALVFLVGAVIGSALFNETFALIKPLYEAGDSGVRFIYDSLGMSRNGFVLLLSVAAAGMFWGSEWLENRKNPENFGKNSAVLKALTVIMLTISVALLIVGAGSAVPVIADIQSESQLLQAVDQALDHIEPEELADRIMLRPPDLLVVDIRPASEYARYHLPDAQNIALKDLHTALLPYQNKGTIVLYSNGMTHPVQARDSLYRSGFQNVYILTDGLNGFIDRCLKPVSLRKEPVGLSDAAKINAWRGFFLGGVSVSSSPAQAAEPVPPLADVEWLQTQLTRSDLKIIDLRPQPEYNTSHIPGLLALNMENLRTDINGVGSMLQPAGMLAQHMSLMGILPTDTVAIVYGDKTQDAALVAMALERLGHARYTILNGGFAAWKSANKPLATDLPQVSLSNYPVGAADTFTVDYLKVREYVQNKKGIILDVRPADYFNGTKSDEARPGHIPGALNRPFSEDIVKVNDIPQFKPVAELEAAYQSILPDKNAAVIIHCRTGHQASQTFFVLKRLLGYKNLFWYDAGWSEWAARKELPAE